MPSWPTTLPSPTLNGYQLAPVDPAIRTDMETGSPRVRRRTAARNDRINVGWIFTDAQMAAFRAWFEDPSSGLNGGSSWFTMNVALGTGGRTSNSCRFVGIYKADLLPKLNWSVTATLEVRT